MGQVRFRPVGAGGYAAPSLFSHDFENGSIYKDGTAPPLTQANANDASRNLSVVADPTAGGNGNVAKFEFINVAAGNSIELGLDYYPASVLSYGDEIWTRYKFYIPSPPAAIQSHNRKLIDWYEQGGASTRMTLHARGNDLLFDIVVNNTACAYCGATGIAIPFDTWVTLEPHVILNSADGVVDGTLEVFKDGELTPTFRRSPATGNAVHWIDGTGNLGRLSFGYQLTVDSGTAGGPFTEERYFDKPAYSATRIGP